MLTGLEVTWWLQYIIEWMKHIFPGVAHAWPTAGRPENGRERVREGKGDSVWKSKEEVEG